MPKLEIYRIDFLNQLANDKLNLIQINLEKSVPAETFKLTQDHIKLISSKENFNKELRNIVKIIRALGFNIITVKQTIPVLNMSCASCAINSETQLTNALGVLEANVNYASTMANIEYIPSLTNLLELKKDLESLGYDLLISDEAKQSLQDLNRVKYLELKKKAIFSSILTLPIVIISMFYMDALYANHIMWFFCNPVVLIFAKDFFISAYKQAKHKKANMDTLVALSVGIAFIFSVLVTLFYSYLEARHIHLHVYFESAAVVISFILLGKVLEEKAKGKTSDALNKLLNLQVPFVDIEQTDGSLRVCSIKDVIKGDIVLAKPGAQIGVDGIVIRGSSFVDESMLSGESMGVEKTVNSLVYAGTINQKGSFFYKVQKTAEETVLASIIKQVEKAQASKAPVQQLVDKVAGKFVFVVIIIALLSFIAWLIFGAENALMQAILAFITVLVIACPCALGLATPTALMVGLGKAASRGILIKDASSLEHICKIDTIVLDKTGTITEGKPRVLNSFWLEESDQNKAILVALEKNSEHPIAAAILDHLKAFNNLNSETFISLPGYGIKGELAGRAYYIGNKKLLSDHSIIISEQINSLALEWENAASTVLYFANSSGVIAIFSIADTIKENSLKAINKLKALNIDVYMFTGDSEKVSKYIAKELGIKHIKAAMLPEDKAEAVLEFQKQGKYIAFIGDGINDTIALARADVGIAMGLGSDSAKEIAQAVIVSSDLLKISELISISKQTFKTLKQNLFWAFIYNIIAIPIAAGILYPINGFLINPMIAAAAMALSSVSVVLNSLLLKKS